MDQKASLTKAANVKILLGEPQSGLRHSLRNALMRDGYENIQDFDRTATLKAAIEQAAPDLVIMDFEMDDGKGEKIIQDIRTGTLGSNPFVPIIVTIWEPQSKDVRRVASSGADDLLVKPLSPKQLTDRIEVLSDARKPFVVTADYIGPDRRKDPSRKTTIRTVDVPNTLRSKLKGEKIDPAALQEEINRVQFEINDQKMKRNAFQISFQVEMLLPKLQTPPIPEVERQTISRLLFITNDIGERLKGTDFEHVATLCNSMSKVLSSLLDNHKNPIPKDIQLLKPLSDAILMSFNPDKNSSDMSNEINSAIDGFKKRQANAEEATAEEANGAEAKGEETKGK